MKIQFIKEFSGDLPAFPLAVYQHDEFLVGYSKDIDIKAIISQHHLLWLDELQASHAQLTKRFSRYTRWWWIAPMSRLDARPWGQEYVLKPLFFARAVTQWLEEHPETQEVVLVGCPYETACYLTEFNKTSVIKGILKIPSKIMTVCAAIKNSLRALLKLGVQFFALCQDHVFQKGFFVRSKGLVLYDLNSGDSIASGHKYYYGNLFDAIRADELSYACITGAKHNIGKGENGSSHKAFYLLDHLGLGDAVVCFLRNLTLIALSWIFIFVKQPCRLGGKISQTFWANYLFSELKRLPCLMGLCSYQALKKVLDQHEYKVIVYPYEEKGSERAILFACEERNIKTIGYTPHPQHRLTLALRDTYEPLSLKPSMYAVCGNAYIEYLQSWGKKKHPISVWGSGKSFEKVVERKQFFGAPVKVLLLISHPNELRVFASWLKSEKRISEEILYSLRLYKALTCKKLTLELKSLIDNFQCVQESSNNLMEDLAGCDIAAFCATSAGIVAVKQGCLAVHMGLDDFFPINPCFDKLEDMLSCASAKQFADCLQRLRFMDKHAIKQLYDRQQSFADTIFSFAQTDNLQRDLCCAQ